MSDIVYKKFNFSTPFLRGYRTMKIPILDAAGQSVWPELFPPDRIEQIRQTVGLRHFSAQMMLQFVASDRVRLDPGAMHIYNENFDSHKCKLCDYQITGVSLYWDPSIGHTKSDGSVCVLLYRDDKNQTIFLHDILYLTVSDSDPQPLTHQCNMILDFMRRHNVFRICIEVNGLGNALPEILHDVSAKQNTPVFITRTTNHANKETRILDAIEPVLTAGRLFAHTRITQTPFCTEMLGWTPIGNAEHDDGLDAVAGAISALPTPIRPLGMSVRQLHANTNFNI